MYISAAVQHELMRMMQCYMFVFCRHSDSNNTIIVPPSHTANHVISTPVALITEDCQLLGAFCPRFDVFRTFETIFH